MQTLLALFASVLLFSSNMVFASEDKHQEQVQKTELSAEDAKRAEMSEYVKHHTKDVHDFHVFSDNSTNAHYGFPLPVIL